MTSRTFLEFFAGGGMARAGLGAGWRCLFANDFDAAKAAAYAAAWGADGAPPPELTVGDVGRLWTEDLPAERADLAWASFPCQDLSLAGAGAGLAGERSGSFLPFHLLMQGLRMRDRAPRVIALENVCGLLTSHGGKDFADICAMLARIGYRFGAVVIDAAEFLPQSRPRLFIVAVDRSMAVVSADGPSEKWHPLRLREAQARLRADLRADWLWFDPPAPPLRTTRFADLIEDAPADVAWHRPDETSKLIAMMSEVNRAKLDAALAERGRQVGGVYKRTRVENGVKVQRAEVRFDDIAGCLRTPGGGSSRQTIVVVERGAVRSRLISARETARLMGLPEDYPLPARYNDAYHLTGDGVAVPVVRHIAEHILEPLLTAAARASARSRSGRSTSDRGDRRLARRPAKSPDGASEPIRYREAAITRLARDIGVYALCDLDGVPIYVGQSVDGIQARVRRHLTSARSDIIANRQLDVWEVAYVMAWPAERAAIGDLEATIYPHYNASSALMNGSVPLPGRRSGAVPEPSQTLQVMSDEEIARRSVPAARLPRQIEHYGRLVDHYLTVKDSAELRVAMEAHFQRLQRYHERFLEQAGAPPRGSQDAQGG